MAEISRILTALGLVVASVGLTTYGIAVAYTDTSEWQASFSIALMIGGVIATVVGIIMSRRIPDPEE